MRLVSWNIRHGGARRVPQIVERLIALSPDIAVVPEFRNNAHGEQLRKQLASAGLSQQSCGDALPNVNTVMLAARAPIAAIELAGLNKDAHRCTAATVRDTHIFGLYSAQKQAKQSLFEYLVKLDNKYVTGKSILIGDFNTGKHYRDESGATFHCARYIEQLESRGWIDAWRHFQPSAREYTWLSRSGNGFRIDHAFVSPALMQRVRSVRYSHAERESCVSDHSVLVVDTDDE